MKKFILSLLVLGFVSAHAQDPEDVPPPEVPGDPVIQIDPDLPVVRYSGTNIVDRRIKLPDVYGSVVNYPKLTNRHYADGWRQAEVVPVTISVTSDIPGQVQSAGNLYQELMESAVGAGSHTNSSLSYESVVASLVLNTNISADVGVRLEYLREMILPYSLQRKAYNFPFGQSNTVRSLVRPFIQEIAE